MANAQGFASPFAETREGVVDAVRDARGSSESVVALVAVSLSQAIQGARRAGLPRFQCVPELASGAMKGALEVGGDLDPIAEGFLLGVMLGTRPTGDDASDLLHLAAGCFLTKAAAAGGDAARAAKGLVEGAVAWAEETGSDAADAASAAGQGALDAAWHAGSAPYNAVRGLFAEPVAGVELLLREPS